MTRAQRRALRVKQLEDWRASALTQESYCKRESISPETFRRWRRRLGEHGISAALAPQFVAVRVAKLSRSAAVQARTQVLVQPVEVVLASGRCLRFGEGLDETSLARLIRLLEVLPC